MNCAKEARKLADFITNLKDSFPEGISYNEANMHYNHIGALFTDIILQAGLNYNTVVKPRVQKVLLNYPQAYSCTLFNKVIESEGLHNVINWKDEVKLNRMRSIVNFSLINEIDTCLDFKLFLAAPIHQQRVMEINGIGPKTLDYLLKLLNFDTVAVDRHIYSFVQMAEIEVKGYSSTKKVVEYAADFLNISRASVDNSIWQYMSKKAYLKENSSCQLSFEF